MKKIIVGLGVCTGIWAQSSDPAKQIAEQRQMVGQFAGSPPQIGPIGIQAAMAGPVTPIAGAPYSAEAVTERVQTLADGNRIVQTSSSTVARDRQGRIRRDESLAIALPGSKGDAPKLEMIDDPVTGVQWRLDPQTKTAVKMVFPKMPPSFLNNPLPPPGAELTWSYSSGAPGSQITIETLAKRNAEADTNVNRVDLGTQTVEGVPAQGTRITRTIPAGEVGNEQPLIITTETWYSPSLKVLVMSKAEDPRMGVTTYRLTNIQRAEPPASLFEIPAEYTIKDQPANTFFFKTKKDQ
jgi:hypothetical protein